MSPSGVVLTSPRDVVGFYGGLLGWRADGAALLDAGGEPVAAHVPGAAPGWAVVLDLDAAAVGAAGGAVDGPTATDAAGVSFLLGPPAVPLPAPGPGRAVWFEHMSTRPADADRFYAAASGWASTPAAPGYALFLAGDRPVAGRLELDADLAAALGPRWMVYLAHGDVDAAAAAVPGLGGTVAVPPRDTPTGRLTAVLDPAGAVLTLLTPAPRR